MRSGGYARHLLEESDILRVASEFVVADESAKGIAAERAILLFVNLLENLALVEFDSLVQVLEKIILADVQELDFEAARGFRLHDEIVQTAPGTLEFLKGLG